MFLPFEKFIVRICPAFCLPSPHACDRRRWSEEEREREREREQTILLLLFCNEILLQPPQPPSSQPAIPSLTSQKSQTVSPPPPPRLSKHQGSGGGFRPKKWGGEKKRPIVVCRIIRYDPTTDIGFPPNSFLLHKICDMRATDSLLCRQPGDFFLLCLWSLPLDYDVGIAMVCGKCTLQLSLKRKIFILRHSPHVKKLQRESMKNRRAS